MRHALATALLALAAALPAVAQAPQANHPSPLTALPPSALPENLRGSVVALAPGIAIVITVLALNVLGDGLRDALDPRSKIRIGRS